MHPIVLAVEAMTLTETVTVTAVTVTVTVTVTVSEVLCFKQHPVYLESHDMLMHALLCLVVPAGSDAVAYSCEPCCLCVLLYGVVWYTVRARVGLASHTVSIVRTRRSSFCSMVERISHIWPSRQVHVLGMNECLDACMSIPAWVHFYDHMRV
jgi:hypothetical protein